MNKKIIFALGIVFVLLLSVVFRSKIGQLVFVGKPGEGQVSPSPTPSVSEMPIPSGSPMPSASDTPFPEPVKPEVYKGRPLDEVRPVSDEVKLFSESQKQDIYNSIGNLAKAIKENPEFFNGMIQLGTLKKTIGDFEGARDIWEYASLKRPQNSVSFANLGELYWRYLHQYNQAELNFKTSIKNDPANPGVYVSLSGVYFYSMKEKAELADDVILDGINANPKSTDLLRALASLYERRGEYVKAIESWQKILAQNPQDTAVAAAIDSLKKKLAN
ncbi:MAG: hypothetical protein Q8R30_03900 [bacterium]|nr:hypothetical protein [bacterium]